MILKKKLDFDLLKSLDMWELMQIHFFRLIFNCSYESIDFQDDNSKDLDVWSFD